MSLTDWILMFAVIAVVAAALAASVVARRKSAGQTATPATASGQPMLAAALSLLIPGAGHALVGAWGRGAVWFAGFLLVAVASQAMHGPLVVVLMILAGFDAYKVAQACGDRPGAVATPSPSQGHSDSEG